MKPKKPRAVISGGRAAGIGTGAGWPCAVTKNVPEALVVPLTSYRYIIGTFAKPERRFVGFHSVEVNKMHRVAQIAFVAGDEEYRARPPTDELSHAIIDEFFDNRGVEKLVARVLARNFRALWIMKESTFRFEAILTQDNLLPSDERTDIAQFCVLKNP